MTQSSNHVFQTFRAGFPALQEQTYLSIADKMILHDIVRAEIEVYLDRLALASVGRIGHEAAVDLARNRFAQLVNASQDSIAVTRNVSDGINSVAWAFEDVVGRNIVLTADLEHPNNLYPWLRQEKRGIELRKVPAAPDGRIDTDAMIAAIDDKTLIVTCPSVSFAPGFRTDLTRLGETCRKRGAFFLVDGVQSAGILHHDFSQEPIDGFATSASKGLLGSYGIGFLYVAEHWLDRLTPAYLSRPAVYQEFEEHSAMGAHEYVLQPNARRFEVGSYNLAGAYGVAASLGLLLEMGSLEIERHVLNLAQTLRDGLQETDWGPRVTSCSDPATRSHIVTIGTLDDGGHDVSNCPHLMALSTHMKSHRISHTIRRGQIRMAFHAFNTAADVAYTLEHISRFASQMDAKALIHTAQS